MKKLITILSFVLLCTSFKSQTTLSFDGANDYVAINKSYSSPISAFTAEAWFKTNYNAGGDFVNWALICFDRSEYWHFSVEGDGRIGFHSTDVNGVIDDFHSSTNPNLVNNTWHHAAVVYDGTDKIIYVDGVEVAKKINAHSGNAIGKSGVTRFGFLGDGSEASSFNSSKNNVYYDGMISETRIWSTARTANEILASYNTALTGNEANLDLYYNFSEGSGSTLNDLSSNGVDGTIVGATWVNDNAPVITCSLSVDAGADLAVCDGGSVTLSLGNSNNGSVGFWPFDGNSNNENGTGSDGTVNGATLTSDLSGNSNSAYLFNGINNDIDLGTGVNNVFSGNSWSFSTWLYYSSNSGFDCFFSSGWPIQMYVNNNYIKVYYSSVDGTNSYLPGANSFNSSNPLSANTWYHVVVTRDGNNNSMYINGALDATSTTTGNIANSSENSRIGSWNGNDFYWEGKIDKVGIWNTAISAQEVQNLNTNYSWDNGVTDGIAFVPTATTTYTVTGTDANGCIATDAVDVTVNALPISTISSMNALCNGSSDGSATVSSVGGTAPYSYLWDDGQTTAMAGSLSAGSYTVTVTDANGCTETQSATVTEPTALIVSAGLDDTICAGDFVTLNGTGADTYIWDNTLVTDATPFSPSATATYTVTGTDANGCNATDQVIVTVNALPTVDAGFDVSVCTGSSVTLSASGAVTYAWDNNITDATAFTPTATATYTVTGTDANGCSATDAVDVSVNSLYYNTQTIGACNGDSVFAGGSYQTASGVFVDSLQSINGCDSVVQTTLTIASQIVANIPLSVCFGDSALINGNYESVNGNFYDTTVSVAGCDSITITNFTVENLITNSVMASVCFGDSLLIGGSYQTVSGAYVDTLTSSTGCDSVLTINYTVYALVTSNISASICNGDSLFLGGAYQFVAGSYVDSLSTASGCDSLVTTTLTVNTASSSTDTLQAACDFTWIDGVTYTVSNSTATFTTSNALGCDSVVTLNLTIIPIVAAIAQIGNDIEASATNGASPYSYDWSTGEITASITPAGNGPYWVVVSDANACSSDTTSFDVTFVSGTGILSLDNVFNIYPNPTLGNITIDLAKQQTEVQVTLYDMYGKLVYLNKYQDSKLIELSFDAPPGIYYLDINSGVRSSRHKIIMQ